jgi:hypothetical protein
MSWTLQSTNNSITPRAFTKHGHALTSLRAEWHAAIRERVVSALPGADALVQLAHMNALRSEVPFDGWWRKRYVLVPTEQTQREMFVRVEAEQYKPECAYQ